MMNKTWPASENVCDLRWCMQSCRLGVLSLQTYLSPSNWLRSPFRTSLDVDWTFKAVSSWTSQSPSLSWHTFCPFVSNHRRNGDTLPLYEIWQVMFKTSRDCSLVEYEMKAFSVITNYQVQEYISIYLFLSYLYLSDNSNLNYYRSIYN